MISEDRLQQAMTYLAQTDTDCARLKAEVESAAHAIKAMKAAIIIREEGPMELRKAKAENATIVSEKVGAWLSCLERYEAMVNKRKTETLIVDVWRSLNASRRVGNIT